MTNVSRTVIPPDVNWQWNAFIYKKSLLSVTFHHQIYNLENLSGCRHMLQHTRTHVHTCIDAVMFRLNLFLYYATSSDSNDYSF